MNRATSQFLGFCALLGLLFSGLGFSLMGPALPAPWAAPAGSGGRIRLLSGPADDPAVGLAVRTLLSELGAGWELAGSEGSAPADILVGRADQLPPELFGAFPSLRPPADAGAYAIGRAALRGRPVLVVAGRDRAGVVYGTLRLAELLRLDPTLRHRPVYQRSSPAFSLRLVGPPLGDQPVDPADALRWGFNAVVVPPWTGAVDYAALDPRLAGFEPYRSEAAWRGEQARRLREAVQTAHAYGLMVFSPGDVPSLPESVLKFYGPEVSEGGRPCFDRPRTQELIRFALTYALKEFDLDGVIIRTGENYAAPPLVGQPIYLAWCAPGRPIPESLRTLLRLEAEVVRATGKKLIQRAWDLGAEGFHASPEVARTVTAGLEPEAGLIISFKHTTTDFWQYTGWNPNLLNPPDPFPRVVEVQGAREYEGKGVFPSYVAPFLVAGAAGEGNPLARARERGTVGLWLWNVGGGWNGPVPRSDLWLDLNAYAVGRLAWDPSENPVGLARAWARRHFSPAAAAEVSGFVLASPELIRLMLYTRAYADRNGPWTPNNLWVRDDEVRGGHHLAPIYAAVREAGAFAEAVAEKEEARTRMRAWAERLEGVLALESSPAARVALASVRYQESLFELLADYFTGMFYFYRWLDGGPAGAEYRALAEERLRAVADRLEAHRRAAAQAGTPFRDAGMTAAVRAALARLEASAP